MSISEIASSTIASDGKSGTDGTRTTSGSSSNRSRFSRITVAVTVVRAYCVNQRRHQ